MTADLRLLSARRLALICLVLTAMSLLAPASGMAQGFLICPHPLPRPWPLPRPRPRPQPAVTYRVSDLAVRANVDGQVAQVEVEQTFVNRGSRVLEASFVFPLPYDGAIDRMTFLVDGKEIPGKLLEADEAARIFQEHVSKNRDPALLQWLGNGVFRTRVFPIPPGAKRTVSLRYTQVLRKEFGLTELMVPLRPAQFTDSPLDSLAITVNIRSDAAIKNIYSPTHDVKIKRNKGKVARVTYRANNSVPLSDFRLMYDVGNKAISTRIVSYRPDPAKPGYFLMLVSPELPTQRAKPQPKTVIFVIDCSGSMSGEKIEQARNALKFVLRNLREGDLFNIIAYDSDVRSYQPELQRFSKKQRDEALAFVDGIDAGGSTNLHGALLRAVEMAPDDDERPTYIVFLTDGRPTTGVTNEAKIVQAVKKANRNAARLYTFGLGFDVNSRLLDKLARGNRGYTVYVQPDQDIEESVAKLYRRIEAPALVNVRLHVKVGGDSDPKPPAVFRIYPRELTDLFAGDQLVIVGRYRRPGRATITIEGDLLGESHSYDFSGKFVKRPKDDTHAYVEKLWAVRRVGDIIDQIDLQGENEELIEELVRLAQRHGILTPYTSFLADEQVVWDDVAGNQRRAARYLGVLKENAAGRTGFLHRQAKNMMQMADRAAAPAMQAGMGGGGFGNGSPRGGQGAVPGLGGGIAGMMAGRPRAGDGAKMPSFQIRYCGRWTFFFRKGKWIDSDVREQDIKQATRLDKVSDEAMKLVGKYGAGLAQALALEGPVVVKLDGKLYEFAGEKKEP